jgi:hypothetical protein
MKKLILISIILFSLITIMCTDNTSPVIQQFMGITETSEDGSTPIGNIDSTDWMPRYDYIDDESSIYTISIPPAFPNPTTRFFTLSYSVSAKDSIEMWIEDKYGNKSIIKSEYVLAGRFDQKIDLLYDDDGNMREPEIYRLFFKVVTRDAVPQIKGDIKLIK